MKLFDGKSYCAATLYDYEKEKYLTFRDLKPVPKTNGC